MFLQGGRAQYQNAHVRVHSQSPTYPRGLHQCRRDVTGLDLGFAYSMLLLGGEGENKASL